MPAHKPQHGGKRHGAGRKPGPSRVPLSVRLSKPAFAKLTALRHATGTSKGKLLDEMIQNQPEP